MNRIADIAAGIVTIALIFVLVRPRSQGPQFVTAVGNSFGSVLKSATGGGTF